MLHGLCLKDLPPHSFDSVVDHDRKLRGEATGLFLPVVDNRCRTDEKYGTSLPCPPVFLDKSQGLDRFTQSHVIGQAGAEPPLPEKTQPGIAAHLIRPQGSVKSLRLRKFLEWGLSIQFP